MTARLSVAIMAHPARQGLVAELVDRLDTTPHVVWDQHGIEWDTGRRALLAHDPAATHHLVLQDDAVVCRDVVAGTARALEHAPADVALSLYFGRHAPYPHQTAALADRADAAGASWLAIGGHDRGLHWGVAVVVPTAEIDELVAWGDRGRPDNYDRMISRWLAVRRRATWYPWPSLVDHGDGPSLIPGHGLRPGRVAHRFIGTDRSALALAWDGPVVTVPSLRHHATSAAGSRRPQPKEPPMPKPLDGTPVPHLVTPRKTVSIRIDRRRHRVVAGETVAHVDNWLVQHRPELWRPLTIHYPADATGPDGIDAGGGQAADATSAHEFEQSGTGPADQCWCGRPAADAIHLAAGGLVQPGGAPGLGEMAVPLPPIGDTKIVVHVAGPVADEAELVALIRRSLEQMAGGAGDDGDEGAGAGQGDDGPAPAPKPPTAKAVRAWAKANSVEVPARGPLPDDIVARYIEAQAADGG